MQEENRGQPAYIQLIRLGAYSEREVGELSDITDAIMNMLGLGLDDRLMIKHSELFY
jgi:hypothetical protein